jgi:hypothetical protein
MRPVKLTLLGKLWLCRNIGASKQPLFFFKDGIEAYLGGHLPTKTWLRTSPDWQGQFIKNELRHVFFINEAWQIRSHAYAPTRSKQITLSRGATVRKKRSRDQFQSAYRKVRLVLRSSSNGVQQKLPFIKVSHPHFLTQVIFRELGLIKELAGLLQTPVLPILRLRLLLFCSL